MKKVNCICIICGKKTLKFPSQTTKFCSKKCANKFQVGRPRPIYIREKISKTMKGVKKSFITRKHMSIGRQGIKFSKTHIDNIRKSHPSGKNAVAWKGGKYTDTLGYIFIYNSNHPLKSKQNYVLEHRLVMEASLGRYLTSKEIVHHINHNPSDNRIENLMLFPNIREHNLCHHLERRDKRLCIIDKGGNS